MTTLRPQDQGPVAFLVVLVFVLVNALPIVSADDHPDNIVPKIAILDSGISPSHPEFSLGQIVSWRDFVSDKRQPYDDVGHGTATASRAAGRTLGAYPGANLVIGKVLDGRNRGSWGHVAEGIRWATDSNAHVISVSIVSSFPQPHNSLEVGRAINYATKQGVLVVWAAGNDGEVRISALPSEEILLPNPVFSTILVGSSSPQALVVGAAAPDGTPAPWSQRDPEVIAEGVNVPIAWNDGEIYSGSGTSFSAPWIAGAAAKLLELGAPRDPDWLKWVLLHSASDSGSVGYTAEGYGFFGGSELQKASYVAQGESPVPGVDERDVFHTGFAVPRAVQTLSIPSGSTPPSFLTSPRGYTTDQVGFAYH